MTDPIKAKIIELCGVMPEHFCCKYKSTFSDSWCDDCLRNEPKIGLADVLRAIGDRYWREPSGTKKGFLTLFSEDAGQGFIDQWNLLKDYDGQTEEKKKLIGSLLGV